MKKIAISPESEFVLQLVHYLEPDYKRINELIELDLDWNQILGILSFHRIAGLAYYVLNNDNIEHKRLHRPIMFGLGMTFDAFYARVSAMNHYILELNDILAEKSIKCAFLKGSLLSNVIYPWGCRASSDVDILVNASDIDNVDIILRDLGYQQGEYDFVNRKVIEFNRRELVYRRMNWGEIAMYHKTINEPCAGKVSIDVNFSLDWHPYNTQNTVEEFLNNIMLYKSDISDVSIYSLQKELFLLQLCIHAHKEVNLFRMVETMQDLELYKFIDIYTFIQLDYVKWDKFIYLVKRYNFEKECYLVFKYIEKMFFNIKSNKTLKQLLNAFDPKEYEYMNEVYDPATPNIKYVWTNSLLDRLFNPNHITFLKKIESEVTTQ
mgnify:CR=1 FL=1